MTKIGESLEMGAFQPASGLVPAAGLPSSTPMGVSSRQDFSHVALGLLLSLPDT
jgi:hypothetical protein